MKKAILFIAILLILVCTLAISASAKELVNYCDIKITLVDGTETVGYCSIDYNSRRLLRDNIYTTPDNSSPTIPWGDIKIFDARETTVVGTAIPKEIAGTNCNSQAENVTEFYFPPTTKVVLNTSFTSGWKSLEKVFIPKSVTQIDHSAFQGSPVKEVVFEEGIALESIGANCFQSCDKLKKIDLPQGVKSLGRNCFYLSGLEGTVVVPNSVTYLAPGTFLSTKIETLILGDGELKIGYNFAGTYNSTQNQYLKNVYISTSTVFEFDGSAMIFFKCTNPVNFYVVGENADAFVETLKSQSRGIYMTFITTDEIADNTGAGYGIIHTGYNRCNAFYGGNHSYPEITDPNQCSTNCERCGNIVYGDNHSYIIAESFAGERYLTACTLTKICESCSYVAETKECGALVYWMGYSVSEMPINGVFGVMQGYGVDEDAISQYKSITGKLFEYGVVAALGTKQAPIKLVEGVAVAEKGVAMKQLTNTDRFEIKICGIKSTDFETALIFNCYILVEEELYYIGDEKTASTPFAVSYNKIKK